MTLPPTVPVEPKRGIPEIPLDPDRGDRTEIVFRFALARANSRAMSRGRQQVSRMRYQGRLTPFWLVQDVR